MEDVVSKDNRSITRPASKVMLGGGLALVGGLASNIIVAALFGAGANMDAYLTAMVVPSYFQIIFYSSLSFVFVPAFIEAEAKHGEADAWALVGTFFWLTAMVLFLLSILGSLFSTAIIHALAPGFQGEKAVLASQMLAILFFTTPFVGLSTLTMGIQNARNRFFWPSFAPALGSLGNVIVLLLFSSFLGPLTLCWGYLVSILLQAAITVIPVLSHGWKQTLPLQDERIGSLVKLMLPLILLGMLISFSPLAERYFSSVLPDGQIAYMGYANKISSIFVVFLASGIASAIFPSMARTYTQEGIAGLSKKNDFGLLLTLAVALPAVLIVGALAVPLTSLFFERGAFQPADTLGVSQIVFAFMLSNVLLRMMGNIFQRSLYVLKDTITQPIVDSVFVVLFIVTARFFVTQWGYVGLVWAGVLRNGLSALVLWALLILKFPRTNLNQMFVSIVKYSSAALIAFIGGRLAVVLLANFPSIVQLTFGGLISSGLYLGILAFLDREMLISILELVGIQYLLNKFPHFGDYLFQRKPGQVEGVTDESHHI
jgi:putative peptidoglycan lipid II flippase